MIDTADWNVTSFHRLAELPASSGVYIVQTDKPLYVGKSANLKLRWKGHSYAMELAMAGAQEVRWKHFPKEVLSSIEESLIEQLSPSRNIRMSSVKRAKAEFIPSTASVQGSGYKVTADCWHCQKCGHVWLANAWKSDGLEPSHCARCKSRTWKQK